MMTINGYNALFITNAKDLKSEIPGGVQLCSMEFLSVVNLIVQQTIIFNVAVSKRLTYRLIRRLGLDSYHLYDFGSCKKELITTIRDKNIELVFVNKAELIKISRLIKEQFGSRVKVILMSHGNETGDFLHTVSKPGQKVPFYKLLLKKLRLGLNLYTESYYRHRYVDLVCAMSAEEAAIEKWLGAKNTIFIPRLIASQPVHWTPQPGKVGFVGTLNHQPNIEALIQVCEVLARNNKGIVMTIIGGPEQIGHQLAGQYPFINYLGVLSDESLKEEITTWMCFLNPVFWFSRGASMKLGQALAWRIPVITTTAGTRGYVINDTCATITADDALSFTKAILKNAFSVTHAKRIRQQMDKELQYIELKEEIITKLRKIISEL